MKTTGKKVDKTYEFTLIYDGPTELTDELENAIFEAGCGDALLSIIDGQMVLDFNREAPSLREALSSAIDDLERTGLPIRLIRFVSA